MKKHRKYSSVMPAEQKSLISFFLLSAQETSDITLSNASNWLPQQAPGSFKVPPFLSSTQDSKPLFPSANPGLWIAASPSAFGQNRCKKPTEICKTQANSNFGIAKLWCIDAAIKEPGCYKNWDTGVFLIWPYVVTHYLICTKMTRPQCAYCQYFPVPWTFLYSMDIWTFLLQLR